MGVAGEKALFGWGSDKSPPERALVGVPPRRAARARTEGYNSGLRGPICSLGDGFPFRVGAKRRYRNQGGQALDRALDDWGRERVVAT